MIGRKQRFLCDQCGDKIRFLDPDLFRVKNNVKENTAIRVWQRQGLSFDDLIAAFAYRDEMREAVLRFKYSGRAEYRDFFSAALWSFAKERIREWKADLIVPVPADARRERERGYNQAELLARGISRISGIKEEKKLLIRNRHTKPQSGLEARRRKENIAGAFSCDRGNAAGQRIILVDDIITTGSTLNEAACVLKAAGASKVFALCLCAD